MNNVEIVEGGHYMMQDLGGIGSDFTDSLYLKKLVKIKHWFKEIDGIVYKSNEDSYFEQIMPLSKFKKKVLYKV